MRIAFSGSHRTGKTTLVEAVAAVLPDHETFDEPYRLLEDDGYELSDPPSREDFERQLRLSIDTIVGSSANALFDRSPVDFVGYLRVTADIDLEDWLPDLHTAMDALDAVVLVAIETPDRIAVPVAEDRRLRRDVDDAIASLYDELGIATIAVTGDVDARVRQVLRAVEGYSGR